MPKAASNREAAHPAAASSASTLILLQVAARALTFVLNQLLVRLVSPSIFGLANIQLELLLSTILFLSRDGFRTILIRTESGTASTTSSSGTEDAQSGPRRGTANAVHNVSLLPIPIGLVFTVAACTAYVHYISPAAMHAIPTFHASIALYALGALAELAYEPLLIRAVRIGQPALRVKAEGAAVFVKVLTTIATVLVLPTSSLVPASFRGIVADEKSAALLAFGIGQASFGLTMLAVHLAHFGMHYGVRPTLDLYVPRPERVPRGAGGETAWIDRPTLSLCATMSKQGILKHLLTEADKIAVARYASLEDQGGYALASNYGSLVARILFQPVEETSRIVFSAELTTLDPDARDAGAVKSSVSAHVLDRVSAMLSALFRLHALLACVLTVFGGPLSTAFLYIMAGPRWALETSAPAILAAYTFYLPIMGINGLVEGFLQSVASQRQLAQYSKVLLTASAGFVGALAVFNTLAAGQGADGSFLAKTALVWANALSLSVRAGWCWTFLISYFRLAASASGTSFLARLRPTSALPSRPTLVVLGLVAVALRIGVPKIMPDTPQLLTLISLTSQPGGRPLRMQAVRALLPTLALAAACLGAVLGSVLLFERRALTASLRSLGRRNASASEADKDTRKTQ